VARRYLGRLLRARRERPRSRTAEQCDELAPFHVWMAPAWRRLYIVGNRAPNAKMLIRFRLVMVSASTQT
jgi:hypothetical protein